MFMQGSEKACLATNVCNHADGKEGSQRIIHIAAMVVGTRHVVVLLCIRREAVFSFCEDPSEELAATAAASAAAGAAAGVAVAAVAAAAATAAAAAGSTTNKVMKIDTAMRRAWMF